MSSSYCGFVTIIGRPNVGKSTLLNTLMGQKLSITSHKPQTTRMNLFGIKTLENRQAVFIDTPGVQQQVSDQLNRYMNRQAKSSLDDVDIVLFMVEAQRWTEQDERVLELIQPNHRVFLLINKIDEHKDKSTLLPFLQRMQAKLPQATLVPVSALRNKQVDELMQLIYKALPESPFYFPEDMICSHPQNYQITEIVREKILRQIHQEVPYCSSVQIEMIKNREKCLEIHALIWVERDGQKKIIIGPKGEKLKSIGTHARLDLEKQLGQKVLLKLWVKVKSNWRDNQHALAQLGYAES